MYLSHFQQLFGSTQQSICKMTLRFNEPEGYNPPGFFDCFVTL